MTSNMQSNTRDVLSATKSSGDNLILFFCCPNLCFCWTHPLYTLSSLFSCLQLNYIFVHPSFFTHCSIKLFLPLLMMQLHSSTKISKLKNMIWMIVFLAMSPFDSSPADALMESSSNCSLMSSMNRPTLLNAFPNTLDALSSPFAALGGGLSVGKWKPWLYLNRNFRVY